MWFLVFGSCLAVALAEPVHIHYDTSVYHGPLAPLDKIGRVVDTKEVAHAKAAHLAAVQAEAAKGSHSYSSGDEGGNEISSGGSAHHHHHHVDLRYHGPPAPLDHYGKVIDTPEVEHAKSAHFHAYQEELAKVKHSEPHGYP